MGSNIVHSQTFKVQLKLAPASTELGTAQLQLVYLSAKRATEWTRVRAAVP